MAALATLSTTTLVYPVSSSDASLVLTSVTNVLPGLCLYLDAELCCVVSVGLPTNNGTNVNVLRGTNATAATAHNSMTPVTIGRGDQFYQSNPVGAAPAAPLVTPWINVLTGEQWTVQGDEAGSAAAPYWARTEYVHAIGAMGVRSSTGAASVVTVS